VPAQAPVPHLDVRLLGGLRVERAGLPVAVPTGRARALLAYLLLQPGAAHGREQLVDRLWPDSDLVRGTRQLTDIVYRLRQALGVALLPGDRLTLRLDPTAGISVDVWEFERLVAAGDEGSLREAVTLYAGELAPDLYDDWIIARRAALADRYRAALATLAERAEAAGETVDAFTYYHWLTADDPMDEAGHQGLIRAYVRTGHPAAAIQQYERLVTLFRAELGVEPSAETIALAEAARREAEDDEPAVRRPFVGRRRARAAILERLESAAGGSAQLVLIEGAAGIGKSRLLGVIAEDAGWRGFQVAVGRPDAAAIESPHAPLDVALAALYPAAAVDRARRRLSRPALEAAVTLLPNLLDRGTSSAKNRPNLAAGLAAMVRELGTGRPILIALDDVHLAGPALWDALQFIEALDDHPIVVLLAFRPDELRRYEASWSAVRRLDAATAPLRISLDGLSPLEAGELAVALGQRLDEPELAELHRSTAGNPLFLTQALGADRDARAAGRGFIDLLERRLDALSGPARRALEAAAVLGPTFTMGQWLALLPDASPDAVEEVIASRLITQLPDRYELEHDLTREHVYATTPEPRRRELHRRAAAALRRERAQAPVVAYHLDRAGQAIEAVGEYRRAAEDALARFAYAESLAHVDRALELGPGPDDRRPLLSLRHKLLGLLLRLDDWRAALDDADHEATATGDRLARIEVLEGRLTLHTLDGDVPAMEEAARKGLELAGELGDAAAEARLLAALGWHVSESVGDSQRAIPMLRRAARLAERLDDEATRVTALCALSSAQRSIGRCRAAWASAGRAMTLVSSRPHLTAGRALALTELAETAFELAEWQDAIEALRAAIAAYRELDNPWSFGSALFGLVNIASGMGQAAEAVAAGEELLALSIRLGIEPTSDFGIWHRVSLGRARLAAADVAGAEAVFMPVASATPGAARPRIAALAFAGQLALARDDPTKAVAPLEAAVRVWEARPEARDVGPAFLLAIAAARCGRPDLAASALESGTRTLEACDNERHAVLAAFARFEVTGEPAAQRAARHALERQAARFRDPALREAFEQNVPLHRAVASGTRSTPATRSSVLRFARASVPLGRPIRDDEWVEFPWPPADARADGDRGSSDPADRRRADLVRLVDAARAAGAAPTDEQLAAALGVSRRTVLRDIRALEREGATLMTRRRRRPPELRRAGR